MFLQMPTFSFLSALAIVTTTYCSVLATTTGTLFVPPFHTAGRCGHGVLVPTTSTPGGSSSRPLRHIYGITPRSNDLNSNSEESSFDAEEARRQLNLLFPESSDFKQSNARVSLDDILRAVPDGNDNEPVTLEEHFPPPSLTATDRDRRLVEIRLLRALRDNDDTTGLWMLWFGERGGRARKQLERAEHCMNNPNQWPESEQILLDLIAEHGPYFIEPINRLAKLYFLQGKHSGADALCRIVLHVKPWHFGALSGIVMVALARNDRAMARYWAARRMPTLANNNDNTNTATHGAVQHPRRAAWVDHAVEQAQQALQRAEERTTRSLGKPEKYYKRENNSASASTVAQDDGNDWQ